VLELAQPWMLLALPAPLLIGWLLPAYREQVSALRVPFFQNIVEAAGATARSGSVVLRRRRLAIVLLTGIWVALVIGLARPQWIGEPITRQESSRDIMLAIDLSGSMDYADFPGPDGQAVSRLTAVQRVVDGFVTQREGDRVGLIVFGTKAYLQLPFTRDLETARQLVALMDVGMAGPKTAIGDAIGLAIHTFDSSEVDDRLLILLTDGNDTASKMTPYNAAGIAGRNGVAIYTIGIGDPEATGEDRVDFELLEQVAERTGGRLFNAEDEASLVQVYDRIDELTPGEVRTETWRPRESLVHWPAGFALLMSLLGIPLLRRTTV
jgi:Ca-activated chloride channel family protein